MIERYTLPEMGEIWTDTYKLKTWLEGRYIHLGLTSSDILDTGLALQMVASLNLNFRKTRRTDPSDSLSSPTTSLYSNGRTFSWDSCRTDYLWF